MDLTNWAGARLDLGRTEAEYLDLAGNYVRETQAAASGGANIRTPSGGSPNGTASGLFTGTDGTYDLTVGYFNEDDGISQWRLTVDGETVASWGGAGGANALETVTVTLDLSAGDKVAILGTRGTYEHARVDWFEIAATNGAPTPTPTPTPLQPGCSPADHDLFASIGQSNAAGHFFRRGGDTTGGALGNGAFEAALESRLGGSTTAINTATSGSGSNENVDSQSYWWNLAADRPGSALFNALAVIASAEGVGAGARRADLGAGRGRRARSRRRRLQARYLPQVS